ncbi:MAG: glycerophosphodiester phosphodiesterase [Arachnia sp.]
MSPAEAAPPIRAIAHRGAPRLARENTLPALAAALAHGADAVEIDVRLTRDERPIVIHDPTLKRLWGKDLVVAETDYETLRRACPATPEGIPDLWQAIEAVTPQVPLVIDVSTPRIAQVCLTEVERLGTSGVAFTGDPEALCGVRAQRADIEVYFSCDDRRYPDAETLAAADPQFVNQNALWTTPGFIAAAHAQGRRVSCYTVNRPGHMRALIRRGVDAIISDDIARLRKVIDAEPSAPHR